MEATSETLRQPGPYNLYQMVCGKSGEIHFGGSAMRHKQGESTEFQGMTKKETSRPRLRFVLHIGANKTGTSAIQTMLHNNRDVLLEEDWDYPQFHLLNMAHHKLASSIGGAETIDSHGVAAIEGDWRQEFLSVTSNSDKRFIFSSELFFRTIPPERVAQYFPPDETLIVLYIRDHLSYMMSWYAQAIQERNLISSFSDFVGIFSTPQLFFIERWERVYGRSRVVIRPYIRTELIGKDSQIDFLQFLDGVDLTKISLNSTESNLSISGNLLFFKRILNNYMGPMESVAPDIVDEIGAFAELKESFRGKFWLPKSDVIAVKQAFEADIAALAARGVVFPSFPEEVHGNPCPNYDTLNDETRLIKNTAIETNKRFLQYASRWQDWHSI